MRGGVTSTVARAVVSSVVGQGIGVATGLQDKFSWAGVAGAAVGALVSSPITDAANALPKGSFERYAAQFASSGASMIANAATRSAIDGSDFGDNVLAALPDTIAQTLGSVLLEKIVGSSLKPSPNTGPSAGDGGAATSGDQTAAPGAAKPATGAAPGGANGDGSGPTPLVQYKTVRNADGTTTTYKSVDSGQVVTLDDSWSVAGVATEQNGQMVVTVPQGATGGYLVTNQRMNPALAGDMLWSHTTYIVNGLDDPNPQFVSVGYSFTQGGNDLGSFSSPLVTGQYYSLGNASLSIAYLDQRPEAIVVSGQRSEPFIKPRLPDYVTGNITIPVGLLFGVPYVGISVNVTADRYGHDYVGIGPAAGYPGAAGGSVTGNWLVAGPSGRGDGKHTSIKHRPKPS